MGNKLSPLTVSVPSRHLPAQSYITRAKCEICSRLNIKTPEPRHWRCSGVFIVNFEHVTPCYKAFIVNFEHVIAGWEVDAYTSIFTPIPQYYMPTLQLKKVLFEVHISIYDLLRNFSQDKKI